MSVAIAGVEPFFSGPYAPCPTPMGGSFSSTRSSVSSSPASSSAPSSSSSASAFSAASSSALSSNTVAGPACRFVPPESTGPGTPVVLPTFRIVSYYGSPLSPLMGILGEYPMDEMFKKLDAQAAVYQQLDPSRPVLRAAEIIAVVAEASPGPYGTYAADLSAAMIDQYAAATRARGDLLILDVQVGRSSIESQVKNMMPYLAFPNVELALDPEFDMGPGQIPGVEIGSIKTSDINWTIQQLSNLVRQDDLPQKVLIVHQFLPGMFPGWQDVKPAPGVAFVTDTDGFGTQVEKIDNYDRYIAGQPIQGFGGMKLFYKWDVNMMTPQEVLALKPSPSLIIYQ